MEQNGKDIGMLSEILCRAGIERPRGPSPRSVFRSNLSHICAARRLGATWREIQAWLAERGAPIEMHILMNYMTAFRKEVDETEVAGLVEEWKRARGLV